MPIKWVCYGTFSTSERTTIMTKCIISVKPKFEIINENEFEMFIVILIQVALTSDDISLL